MIQSCDYDIAYIINLHSSRGATEHRRGYLCWVGQGGCMKDNIDTRQRIILAAIDILNTDGISSITTRRIASEAGVNSAALNYHFGTKEKLVDYILHTTLEHAFSEWKKILEIEELEFPVRLYCLLDYTIEGVLKYPGVSRSHLFDPDVIEKSRIAFARKTSLLLDMLCKGLEETSPRTPEELRLSLGQILLSTLSAAMIPELFEEITGESINSFHPRATFILHLLKRFLGLDIPISDIIRSNIANVRVQAFKAY